MKYETGEKIAFIDLEYGHVYGTHKRISLPTEVGVAFYDESTNSVDYSGRKFTFDIDIEQWKNITDQYGNKIGVKSSVANLEKEEYNKLLDDKYKLDCKQKKKAYQVTGRAYKELNHFMNHILKVKDVDKIVFFGDRMERGAFKRAKIDINGFEWIDVQKEIKNECGLEMLLSLDKVSQAIKFRNKITYIQSLNFKYDTPDKYKYLIKPHKALGDSARIFLAYKEFNLNKKKFKKTIENHLVVCKANLQLISTENNSFSEY